MVSVTKDWNPNQKRLSALLKNRESFSEAMDLCVSMHNELHDIGNSKEKTIYRELLFGLEPEGITFRPERHFGSIAWNIWHITRIEDAIASILIADEKQVFTDEWKERMNARISDTGNAFTEKDVDGFDGRINAGELLEYRTAVGKQTRSILKCVKERDLKRKPTERQLERILKEKALTIEKDSVWLLEFWGNKTVSGLLTMPITRHQMVHINDCFKLKQAYQKKHGR